MEANYINSNLKLNVVDKKLTLCIQNVMFLNKQTDKNIDKNNKFKIL